MIRISDALYAIIKANPLLQFGLHHRIFNLTQLARFLRPLIAARTRKELQNSAIVMALSRVQRSGAVRPARARDFTVEKLIIQPGLSLLSLERSAEAHRRVLTLYNKVQENGGYLTVTEGMEEITLIFDERYRALTKNLTSMRIVTKQDDLAALRIRFSKQYLSQPGFLFAILQSLTYQNINLIEVASSATEFIVYVAQADIQLAFDTIYTRFRPRPTSNRSAAR